MRYKPDQKEQTRQRILEAASRGFRQHGYAGIGVDGLARGAEVTSGAFYAHFGSKDAAFDAALAAGLDEVREGIPRFQREHGTGWVQAFADYYLGQPHRRDLSGGCAMTTLTPEVVRAAAPVHAAFELKMAAIVDLAANGLAGGGLDARRGRAWAYLSTLIGGLSLARAVKSEAVADQIADAVKSAAVCVAGPAR